MADGHDRCESDKHFDQDELIQEKTKIKAEDNPVIAKSKRYSRRKSDGTSKLSSSNDRYRNNGDRLMNANGPKSRATYNDDVEQTKKDHLINQETKQNSCKEMAEDSSCRDSRQRSSMGDKKEENDERKTVDDKETERKERKTRRGFEPYQIKRGKLYGEAALTDSQISINKNESKGPIRGGKTDKDSKHVNKKPSPKKTSVGEQKGKKEFQGSRTRVRKGSSSWEKKKTESVEQRATEEENWDDQNQSSNFDKNRQASDKDTVARNNVSPTKSHNLSAKMSDVKLTETEMTLDSSRGSVVTANKTVSHQNKHSNVNSAKLETTSAEFLNQLDSTKSSKDKKGIDGHRQRRNAPLNARDTDLSASRPRPNEKKIYQVPTYHKKDERIRKMEGGRESSLEKKGNKNLDGKYKNAEEKGPSGYMELINQIADEGEMDWDLCISEENKFSTEGTLLEGKDNIHKTKESTKKVAFVDEPKSNVPNSESKSLNLNESTSKKAGIIVLPSPDVLKKDLRMKLDSEEDKSRKLYDPVSNKKGILNVSRERPQRNRERAEFVETSDLNHDEIIDSKSIRITSSGEELWKETQHGVRSLKKLLSEDFDSLESLDKMLELSAMLQDLFKELIVKHQDLSFKNDVEGCLWKSTFHNMISKFRFYLDEEKENPHINEISQCYWNVLQDGDDFLEDLLNSIQEEHHFDVHEFAANPLKMSGCKKQVKLAVRSCHLILLYLGDLERYIADLKSDNNYSKANEKYQKAQSLAPKNGKSYNQMAIVAVKCKRKLDALYYYVRSLEASNPIESARERLTGIFQDIKRKAEQTKSQSTAGEVASFADAVKMNEQKRQETEEFLMDYSREDVWVFYRAGRYYKMKITPSGKIQEMGSHSDGNDEEGKEKETTKVSLRELNKEFLIYYLYMQSKLYTRIGFETIMVVYQDTLGPLKLLLKHEKASSMKRSNLVKYMAINIFSVNNLFNKQDHLMDVVRNSPIDTAIIFGMDMCSHIAAYCATLLQSYTKENQKILDQFLPAVRTWMKWMCGYMDLIKQSSVCHMKDIWENMVMFFNATRSMKIQPIKEHQDGEPTALFEDVFLAGFQPLIDMETPSMKVPKDMQELAEQFMRSESLKDMTYMISESHKLPIIFNENSSSFEVLTPEVLFDSPAKNGETVTLEEDEKDLEDDESDVIIEDVLDEDSDEESRHFRELMAQKMMLTAKLKEQERREKERMEIVRSNTSQVHMISENHPNYIVPDTNCFIDNLEGLKKIIDSKDFTIILPLIVVNELDGLKKGTISNKYPSEAHAFHVKERARLSIELLEQRFSEGASQLKALTSVGTELDTIAFRDEELSRDQGKNDDIILSCCLHYCEEVMNRYSSNEGPLVVQRKVVLLTDDRNLRLKAHSRNVPTISMKTFLKMAKL